MSDDPSSFKAPDRNASELDDKFRDEEARKTAILEAALDCIVTMDIEGNIVDFNVAAERTFGYQKSDVAGRPLAETIIPEEFRDAHRNGLARFLRTRESNILGKRIELTARRADGSQFPVELAVNVSHQRDGSPFFTGYLRDITQLKEVEQRLIGSEARSHQLAEVVERSNDFIGIATPDGKAIYVNEAGRRMVGLDPDFDISQTSILDYIADDDRKLIEQTAIPAVQREGRWRGAVHYRHWKTGESIPTLWNAFVIRDPTGPIPEAWVTISPDLTELRGLELALRDQEGRLSALVQAASQMVWSTSADGEVIEDSPSWRTFTGQTFDEFKGFGWASAIHADDREATLRAWKEAVREKSPLEIEYRVKHVSGEWRWTSVRAVPQLHEDGSVKRWVGMNTDITERKLAELRAQRDAEVDRFLSQASDVLSASLVRDDTMAHITQLCVPTLADWAFLDLFDGDGKSRRVSVAHADPADSELAKKVARFPAQPHAMDHPPARALYGGEEFLVPEFTEEMLIKAAQIDEHEQVMRAVAPKSFIVVPLLARGNSFGALTLVASTSGRRYGEDDLKVARELARRASTALDNACLYEAGRQANIAKSDFLANMSHEIRTPMTAVLGYADLLAAREDDAEKAEYLRTIKRNGNFLLEIINDILDLSKIEAGKMELAREPFAVHDVVADVRSMMQVRASEKNLEFQVEFDGRIPAQIKSDPKRLKQILVNLIGNAIKFTETGSVRLVVRFLSTDQPLIQFDVIDTGIGMTNDQQTRLFQPFSQGDASVSRSFGGTGLGLAISQRVATMLGGRITVTSQFGEGSTFSCTIAAGDVDTTMRIQPRLDVVAEPEVHRLAERSLNCRVLIVDDRRDVRLLAQRFLAKAGAEVDFAEDGQHALEAVKRILEGTSPPVDLILLDMQMPRLDGYQTAARLREMGFRRPIIALTADAMHGDMNSCLESGCDAYLCKPIDANLLLNIVAEYTQKVDDLEQKRRQTTVSQATSQPIASKGLRVLVVDDSVDACTATQRLLQFEGFKVQAAHTGQSAIELSKSFVPRIVLLDITLPDMNGFETLARLKDLPELKQTRFIALTGHSGSADHQRSREAGFERHLVKPVDIAVLLELLHGDM